LSCNSNYFNLAGKPPRGTTPLDLFAPALVHHRGGAVRPARLALVALPFHRQERPEPVLEQAV